ncbi:MULTISPECIES: alpha/beta fold hydrolase [unclassified Streptomyces]|uniref:Alpha/beta fold hydrolase n=2 Tax=Streptomyces TaxID=1883 RepID=A0AAU1HW75_9ACTN|nr:alpha/beta fold hydrolase [Streptomyces sp. NBC_01017]
MTVPTAHTERANVRVLAVQYPGRQDGCAEPVVESVARLADEIARLPAASQLASPPVLFGHSLGALVAFGTGCPARVPLRWRACSSPAPLPLGRAGTTNSYEAAADGILPAPVAC